MLQMRFLTSAVLPGGFQRFGLEQLSVPHQQKHTQRVHAEAEGLIVTAVLLCSGLRVQMFWLVVQLSP